MLDPLERSEPIHFVACLFIACLLLGALASAAPSITLSKKLGPPTSKILISGRGFEANAGVDIFFDTKDKALVVTNGRGEFHDIGVHAPSSARPGKHWVTALERNNDKGAQEPFLVRTDWRQFGFDPQGTRLNPYENVLNPRTVRALNFKWSYLTNANTSPAVANGMVYVGCGMSSAPIACALDADTGALVWSFNPGDGAGLASPAVANGMVYLSSGSWVDQTGKVIALNAITGTKLWSFTTDRGGNASPTVANGVVYVGSDDSIDQTGKVYALNAMTGAKLWSYTTPSRIYSSPAVASGVAYVGSADGTVFALNASTGAKLWSNATGAEIDPSPAVANGVVYVGGYNNIDQIGKVYALDATFGFVRWNYTTAGCVCSSPAVANGTVYVGSRDGAFYALNAITGAKLWSYGTSILVSAPAVANGVVYVGSEDSNMYAPV